MNIPNIETTYCTLYRLGHWASLDAKCETDIESYDAGEVISYTVHFALIGKYGDVTGMGIAIFLQSDLNDPTVLDEDGKYHSSLDAAIRAHADWLVKPTPMPGLRVLQPPAHKLYDSSSKVAFHPGPEVCRE